MCEIRGNKPNPLAKELGISSGAVTRWKNSEDPPSGKTLVLLADKLDCSVDYLLGRADDPGATINSSEDAEVLRRYHALSPDARKAVDCLLEGVSEQP